MTQAYILINCDAGKAALVVKKMRRLAGVKNAKVVTGLHDIVALVESGSLATLAKTVVSKVQTIRGVGRTVTMVCVDV